jgi:hypothetical protein
MRNRGSDRQLCLYSASVPPLFQKKEKKSAKEEEEKNRCPLKTGRISATTASRAGTGAACSARPLRAQVLVLRPVSIEGLRY